MTLEDRCKAQLGQLLFDVMSLQAQIEDLKKQLGAALERLKEPATPAE